MVEQVQIRHLEEAASVDLTGADWAVFQLEESAGGEFQKVRGETILRGYGSVTEKTTRDDSDTLAVIIEDSFGTAGAGELRRIRADNFLDGLLPSEITTWDNARDATIDTVRLLSPQAVVQAITANASTTSGISEAAATALIATWARATSPTGTIPSARLDLQASDIPDIDADKITSGTLSNDRLMLTSASIPVLPTSKITTGVFPAARTTWVGTQTQFEALTAGDFVNGQLYSIHED